MTTLPHPPLEAYADAAGVAQVIAFAGPHWYGSAEERLAILREELTRLKLGNPFEACPTCAAPVNLCPDIEGHARQDGAACPNCGAGETFNPGTGPEPGYVAGRCGHRVAGQEWRAGCRTCERCSDPGCSDCLYPRKAAS